MLSVHPGVRWLIISWFVTALGKCTRTIVYGLLKGKILADPVVRILDTFFRYQIITCMLVELNPQFSKTILLDHINIY